MESLSLDFPAEVVIEILSWLPNKSLFRFRCVSKPWLHLLTKDPHFTKLYQDRSIGSNRSTSFLFTPYPPIPGEMVKLYSAIDITACDEAVELDSSYLPSDSEFVSSICNGLVCLGGFEGNGPCIWNPLTKDYVVIPTMHSSSHFPSCDEITSGGFGYREDTNQCTVITFCILDHTEPGFMSHVSLYTLGRDSAWRTLENVPYYVGDGESKDALVSGALHWLAFEPCCTHILSFNMKDEIFKVIPLPNGVRIVKDGKFNPDIKIGELGGLLCVFIMPEGENVQIWVMEEYSEVNSWTKKFIIEQPDFCPLGVTHDKEIILLNRENDGKLILYNPKTTSIRNKEFGFEYHNAFIFIRSILSQTLIRGAKDTMT